MRPSSPWRTPSKAGTLRASTKTRTICGSESYDTTIEQWHCGSIWDHGIAGAWKNATKYVVRRWMERWPWLWILLPLCSAGIVSFSHFRDDDIRLAAHRGRVDAHFIGLLGGAAPAGPRGPLVGRHQRSDARCSAKISSVR